MRNVRVCCAGAVLVAASVAAVWLYTYRAWDWVRYEYPYEDRTGNSPIVATQVSVQPWWGTYGGLALALIGLVLSLWLLAEDRRFIRRFFARLGGRLSAKPS
jgi:hypothetical protein